MVVVVVVFLFIHKFNSIKEQTNWVIFDCFIILIKSGNSGVGGGAKLMWKDSTLEYAPQETQVLYMSNGGGCVR